MPRNALGCALAVFLAMGSPAVAAVLVYETDFSSDPGWITNNSDHYRYDSSSRTYYGVQIDGADEYAYTVLSGFDSTQAWKLQWDQMKTYMSGTGDARFGLFNANLNMDVQAVWVDAYAGVWQTWYASNTAHSYGDTATGLLSLNVWYRTELEYSPAEGGTLTTTIRRISDGALMGQRSLPNVGVFTVDRLGTSNIHDVLTGEGRFYIDNVALLQVPEPATLTLLAFSSLMLRRARRQSL